MSDYCQRKNKEERRRIYGEMIRVRNNRRHGRQPLRLIFSDNFTHYRIGHSPYVHLTESDPTLITDSRSYIQETERTLNPIYRNTIYDARIYDDHSYKNNNERGLIHKNLFENSTISTSQIKEFCIVCQDNINVNDIIRTLGCFHRFHVNCVDEWFIEQSICPLCKQAF